MSQLVSIIMPVYNGAKYLHRSINAVLTQENVNLELILINDGSTDNSKAICKEFEAADSRVRYFEQENHGQGYTRAKGIELAKGTYVAFVDQDDWMRSKMYGTMMNAIIATGADVCVCQWNYEFPDGTHMIDNTIYDDSFYGLKTSIEFARYLYKYNTMEPKYGYANGVVVSPWNKLYRKELLKGFTSSGYLGEDEDMNDYVFSQSNVMVCIIKDEFYYWCQNLESMSNRPFSSKKWGYFDALEKRLVRYRDEFIIERTHKLIFNYYIENYYKALDAGIKPPGVVKKLFHTSCWSLVRHKKADAKTIVRMLMFLSSPALYKRIVMR